MGCYVMMDGGTSHKRMISGQHASLACWRLDLAGVARMLIKPLRDIIAIEYQELSGFTNIPLSRHLIAKCRKNYEILPALSPVLVCIHI